MISQRVAARAVSAARSLSSVATFSHDQLIKFPREEEGNQYSITRSVNTDGVVPSAKVYRNARNATLQQYLKTKVQGNVAKIDAFPSDTSLEVREAGDSISHGEFADVATQVKKALGATGVDLLVEDAAAGSHRSANVGVRVITDCAATALAARALLVPQASIQTQPSLHARFDGWNLTQPKRPQWNGTSYEMATPSPAKGQRPIVVFAQRSGPSPAAAVSFLSRGGKVAGADVVLSGNYSLSSLARAVGHAAAGLINETAATTGAVAIPASTLVKGDKVALVMTVNGADSDALSAAATSQNILHAGHYSVVSSEGVASLLNGAVAPADAVASTISSASSPIVVGAGNMAAVSVNPVNMVTLPTHVIIVDSSASADKKLDAAAVTALFPSLEEVQSQAVTAVISKLGGATVVSSVQAAIASL